VQGKYSQAELLSLLPESKKIEILNELTDEQAYALEHNWHFWDRPEHLPPKECL